MGKLVQEKLTQWKVLNTIYHQHLPTKRPIKDQIKSWYFLFLCSTSPPLPKGIKDAGLIPRLITDMFQKISILSNKLKRKYTVYCSFLEIYNERIYDLLNPDQLSRLTQASTGLKLRWHKKDQFLVDDLCIFQCDNPEDLLQLFYTGVKNKTMASHKLNSSSSRSHCVFEIRVEFTDRMYPDDIITSKMTLVDLAGSERSSVVNSEGRVAKEAIEINKSLFTLRQVINAIVDAQNKGNRVDHHHIPFRDSKLTSLLKQSFGGNAYCLMVIEGIQSYSSNSCQ